MGLDTSPIGQAPGTEISDSMSGILPTNRGWTNMGLRTRPLATGTIQITGGTDDPANTVQATVNGVAISAAVEWVTSHNATAAALAVAINAQAGHNYVATAATDTVTVRQRTSGAITGALDATVTGDVTTTDVDFSGDTDTWTEFVSGATFDGDLYYELGWSGALVLDGPDLTNARVTELKLYCDGQAFQLWSGGLRANSGATAIVQGNPTATATWTEWKPWLDASTPLIIKVAADEEVLYEARYI